MANAPLRRCSRCKTNFAPRTSSYCTACQPHVRTEYHKQNDLRRGSPSARGYDNEWNKFSAEYRSKPENKLCRQCLANGYYTDAVEVDHIIPLDIAPEKKFELSNLQPLCRRCHKEKDQTDKEMYK